MEDNKEPIDYNRPVAYDTNGQPLYAHPPVVDHAVHEHKRSSDVPLDKDKEISDVIKLKHIKSQKVFPELVLNEGDFVISSIHRHMIGLFAPFTIGVITIALALTLLLNYDIIANLLGITGAMASPSAIFWPVIIFALFVLLSEYVVYYVFINNKFFLTNDSVIQQTQTGLFSNSEHKISLGNIEDASYKQSGILQQFFNYGSIRLSTEGEETTYQFTYVDNPKECIATLDSAIENFKNHRRDDC